MTTEARKPHMSPENVIRRIERVAVEKGLRPEAALEEIESLAVGYRLAANEPRDETGYPAFSGLPRSSRVSQIAHDFAAIPFENHEAKILALAYIELQEANQWLRDDIVVKVETIERIEEQLEALRKLEDALRRGWPKAVLVDRDGANEEMLAFPISDWWPVRDALAALNSNPAISSTKENA